MRKLFGYAWFTIIMPELVVWMIYLKSQGWTTAQVAILEGTFTLFSAIFELPSGMVADKIGRKLSVQMGESFCIVYLLSYFFPNIKAIIFIGFIFFALGLALISGSDVSLLYDGVGSKKKYLKYLGYFNSIQILGTAFGNSIGGWLSQISWSFLFITSIIIRIIALILISTLNEKSFVVQNNAPFRVSTVLKFVRENRTFKLLLISIAFSESAITLSYQYGPLLFSKEGIHTGYISIIFGVISIFGAIAASMADKMSNILGKKRLVILFITSIFSFTIIYWLHTQVLLLVILFILPNIIYEIWSPILENEIQMISKEAIRASVISMINLVTSLILTIGSYVVSVAVKKYTIVQVISVNCTILIFISLISYIVLIKRLSKY